MFNISLSILIFLIETCSLGGFFDPVTSGLSFRVGKENKVHIVGGFGEGKKEVYSDDYEWKPFHWINCELKFEHCFNERGLLQPYIATGIAYRDAAEWKSFWIYKPEPDSSYCEVREIKENYLSGVVGIGLEFNLGELSKDVPVIENISFQIEFPTIYYKFKEEVTEPPGAFWYYNGKKQRYGKGIGGGLGIHYNFR
ncbi:MAG: hypothetical protein COT45_06100 [bacterium (Candidatus Stahlbacteria) CG08_land_8_20_14_0_20_40_26]|nr:MAG: hypothetical protein COX49_04330 [bacterium (Candidatus Stahlbacteria) CG23_combo_of_CG06-09_8_20_14_all_40_9]PIS23548.1 MAG: hypothetical protein COT45_06100 [bacterium (Candidatus Stahlbacteria) CG08_land_8_20_14_0_20_40_26]